MLTNTRTLSPHDVSEIANKIGIGSPDPNTIKRIVRGWFLYVDHHQDIQSLNGTALVPSQSISGAYYIVTDKGCCSCMDCQGRGILCKHKIALMIKTAAAAAKEITHEDTTISDPR